MTLARLAFVVAVLVAIGLLSWRLVTAQAPASVLTVDDGSIRYPRYSISLLNNVPTLLDAQTGKMWTRLTLEIGGVRTSLGGDGQRETWIAIERLDSEADVRAWLARQGRGAAPR